MAIIELKIPNEVAQASRDHIRANWDKWVSGKEMPGTFDDKVCGEIGMRMVQLYWHVPGEAIHPVLERSPDRYDFKWRNYIWDVKTRRSLIKPLDYYRVNVLDFQIQKPIDYYVHVVIKDKTYDYVWLVGYIDKPSFLQLSEFHKEGDKSETNPKMTYLKDTRDIAIELLTSMESLLLKIKEPRHICADEEAGVYCAHIFCGPYAEARRNGTVPEPCPDWHKHR